MVVLPAFASPTIIILNSRLELNMRLQILENRSPIVLNKVKMLFIDNSKSFCLKSKIITIYIKLPEFKLYIKKSDK